MKEQTLSSAIQHTTTKYSLKTTVDESTPSGGFTGVVTLKCNRTAVLDSVITLLIIYLWKSRDNKVFYCQFCVGSSFSDQHHINGHLIVERQCVISNYFDNQLIVNQIFNKRFFLQKCQNLKVGCS